MASSSSTIRTVRPPAARTRCSVHAWCCRGNTRSSRGILDHPSGRCVVYGGPPGW